MVSGRWRQWEARAKPENALKDRNAPTHGSHAMPGTELNSAIAAAISSTGVATNAFSSSMDMNLP